MNKKCFIMGLPGAGKTTFLAALWHTINNNLFSASLKLDRIDNGQYLTQLSQKWVDAEPLDRTVPSNEQTNLSIKLKAPDESVFDLFFPDLSGETFQKQYVQRSISEELEDYILTADAILFFIHVDSVKSIGLISEHMTKIQDNGAEPPLVRDPKKHDPLQVQVIELMQFIADIRKGQLTKVNFVFSAWDLILQTDSGMTPAIFFSTYMNMLWQFCYSNSDIIHYDIWGISAQGADYAEKDVLLEKDSPVERILVADSDGNIGSDITLPLYLILGENK